MRGKEPKASSSDASAGITPAYAGKRQSPRAVRQQARDHPRVCGEKAPVGKVHLIGRGSPPRMRGKGPTPAREALESRITPAYAGKSSKDISVSSHIRDHPRICGEKGTPWRNRLRSMGSPPHMRGKEMQGLGRESSPGITPAYAGKSWRRCRNGRSWRDHPRICGEKLTPLL